MVNQRELSQALQEIQKRDPFSELLERGYSREELKESIKEALAPHFQNEDILEENYPVLISEVVNLSFIYSESYAKEIFSKVKRLYRRAASEEPKYCFKACARFESDTTQGLSRLWSQMYLEHDKADLPLEELRQEAFRNIGDLIEGSLKPYLQELVLQNRFLRGKTDTYEDVVQLDLGNLVHELKQTTDLKGALEPHPWELRLNDWRNIAQHHTSEVDGDEIVGYYEVGSTEEEVRLTRREIVDATFKTALIFKSIRTARTLFVVDHMNEIKPHISEDPELRPDMRVLSFAMAIGPEGFELIDLKVEEDSAEAVVRDRTEEPIKKRMIHASQFVYPVWKNLKKQNIELKFQDSDGNLVLTSKVNGDVCESIAEGQIPFSELANESEFEIHGAE